MTEKFLAYIRYKARCRELKYEPVDYETWAAQSIARLLTESYVTISAYLPDRR